MFIVDSHLHFFPHDFFAALVRQKDVYASVERALAELAARTKIELPDRDLKTHLQRWLRNWFGAAMPRGCWNGELEGGEKE